MSDQSIYLRLFNIKTWIAKILDLTLGMDFKQYEGDVIIRADVERYLLSITEAASIIPEEYKNNHPEVQWELIADFRNFIVRRYFGIVWDIIRNRLEDLSANFDKLID